jgi:hypothetical protein
MRSSPSAPATARATHRREAVRALRDSRDRDDEKPIVLCTQITPRCCTDPTWHRPGIIKPHDASLSAVTTPADWAVACASTILAEFGPERLAIQRIDDHQAAVDRLKTSGESPLCRP